MPKLVYNTKSKKPTNNLDKRGFILSFIHFKTNKQQTFGQNLHKIIAKKKRFSQTLEKNLAEK